MLRKLLIILLLFVSCTHLTNVTIQEQKRFYPKLLIGTWRDTTMCSSFSFSENGTYENNMFPYGIWYSEFNSWDRGIIVFEFTIPGPTPVLNVIQGVYARVSNRLYMTITIGDKTYQRSFIKG